MEPDKKVLLHICCAPCAVYPAGVLDKEGYSVSGYWYNPNIHGRREYSKRLMALGYYVAKTGKMDIIEDCYDPGRYFSGLPGTGKEKRCGFCYRIRLDSAARKASETGHGFFTTTLLYSRYQDHEDIRAAALEASGRYGVEFLYRDFRTGWQEGVRGSIEMGLYRQQYCGCIFSEIERFECTLKK